MKGILENIAVFIMVLVILFLFSGPEPTPFHAVQSYVRGSCK